MDTTKAFIDNDKSTADISCPRCRKVTRVSLAQLGCKHRCKVKCSCLNIFMTELEFRDKYRKRVDFQGYYVVLEREQEFIEEGAEVRWESVHINRKVPNCLVIDLSRGGIGFITLDEQYLGVGDIIHVKFKLDNESETEISQTCQVRHVTDSFVGTKMIRSDLNLGFYLLG